MTGLSGVSATDTSGTPGYIPLPDTTTENVATVGTTPTTQPPPPPIPGAIVTTQAVTTALPMPPAVLAVIDAFKAGKIDEPHAVVQINSLALPNVPLQSQALALLYAAAGERTAALTALSGSGANGQLFTFADQAKLAADLGIQATADQIYQANMAGPTTGGGGTPQIQLADGSWTNATPELVAQQLGGKVTSQGISVPLPGVNEPTDTGFSAQAPGNVATTAPPSAGATGTGTGAGAAGASQARAIDQANAQGNAGILSGDGTKKLLLFVALGLGIYFLAFHGGE